VIGLNIGNLLNSRSTQGLQEALMARMNRQMPQVPTPQPMMPSPSPVQRGPNVNMDALMRMREMMMQRRQPRGAVQAPVAPPQMGSMMSGLGALLGGEGFGRAVPTPLDRRFIGTPEQNAGMAPPPFAQFPAFGPKPTPPSDPSRVDMRWEQFRNNTSPIRTADWREGRDYIRDQNTGEIIHLDNNGFPIVRNPRKVNSDGTRVAPPGIKNPFMDNQLFQRQPATPFPPPMQQPPMMPPQMAPQPPQMMQPVMPAPQPMPQMPMMPQMPQQNMGRQGFDMAPNVAMFAKGGRVRMADMMKEYF
jgi:hypothetical protein